MIFSNNDKNKRLFYFSKKEGNNIFFHHWIRFEISVFLLSPRNPPFLIKTTRYVCGNCNMNILIREKQRQELFPKKNDRMIQWSKQQAL